MTACIVLAAQIFSFPIDHESHNQPLSTPFWIAQQSQKSFDRELPKKSQVVRRNMSEMLRRRYSRIHDLTTGDCSEIPLELPYPEIPDASSLPWYIQSTRFTI
jgi:hypothetical protein